MPWIVEILGFMGFCLRCSKYVLIRKRYLSIAKKVAVSFEKR